MLFKKPVGVDKTEFKRSTSEHVLYGLPKEVRFCKSCVISNQRPNSAIEFKNDGKSAKQAIGFDDQGICDACKVKDYKERINWEERSAELKELCNRYRRSDGRYDCLVPGSGGKDSFMTAHILKYEYGMNPLTVTWAPHIYTDWGWRNHQAWIHAGFDNILFTPNGRVHRLISRLALENLFHPFQPFILGQQNLAPKIAIQHDIKLIFYGENQAEYGNPLANMESAKRSWEFFASADEDEIFLGGSSLAELREMGLKPVDWNPYMPLDSEVLAKNSIEYHYLGYYVKWHPQGAYYYAVDNGGFESAPERTAGTYNTYSGIDDKVDDFHYHTTYIKFGIGRATYDAAQEVRSGDILREEGQALVRKYDGEFPERWASEVFEYLSINSNEFPQASKMFEIPRIDKDYYDLLSESFRSPHLWKYSDDHGWNLRHTVFSSKDIDQERTAGNWKGNSLR